MSFIRVTRLTRSKALWSSIRCASSFVAPTIVNSPSITHTESPPKRQQLEDSFGRQHNYLRISLTERCNLRCQYCMPEDGIDLTPQDKILSNDEVLRIAKLFVKNGVNKIRLTGGEPLVRRDLIDLCTDIGALPGLNDLAITTNGITLKRKLPKLQLAGVNLLNISLDTLVPAKFELITRRKGHAQVMAAINDAISLGFEPVKVNCVMKRGMNDDELLDFVEWTRHSPVQVRFIEYMPFDDNKWNSKAVFSYIEMVDRIQKKYPEFSRQRRQDGSNPTSKTWHVPGFQGSVGFISSMSDNFCGTCNRMRVTADGNLKVCLFGSEEYSLRDAMRQGASDAELDDIVHAAIFRKHAKLGGHGTPDGIAMSKNRPMILIVSSQTSWFVNRSPRHARGTVSPLEHFQRRHYSTNGQLTHIDDTDGRPTMVDVGDKKVTQRTACAQSVIDFPPSLTEVLTRKHGNTSNQVEIESAKGPVFTTAIIAGTMGAKKTSELIPFCHPLPVEKCKFEIEFDPELPNRVVIKCTVGTTHKTGVEMEALTGASIAALAVYDMCKAMSHSIVISETKLISKTGGKSDFKAS